MTDNASERDGAGSDFDLSQFHEIFFEEASENLESMEQLLLGIDLASADDETLNSIFRCAHSVKGGAATFGFNDIAVLTHQMESLLDRLRRRELQPTPAMVDVLLQSGDALKAQVARHQKGGEGDTVDTAGLLLRYESLLAGSAGPDESPEPPAATASATASAAVDLPAPAQPEIAEDTGFGFFSDAPGAPGTAAGDPPQAEALAIDAAPAVTPSAAPAATPAAAPAAKAPEAQDAGFGFFSDAPGAPGSPKADKIASAPAVPTAGAPAPGKARAAAKAPSTETATLRVSVEKVDQLINLVGELVITQASLAQTTAQVDMSLHQQMAARLADLERNTRDLQESVMSIRMIPMSVVFNRFPRMLRDLASRLGKSVEFVTQGEATELDKGMVEKITDPLTHLVRNSCDHGIEMPEERRARGKAETGTITLAASHQGGSIVIEVRDDGKGLNRERLLQKAKDKGIDAPDSLSDGEVWNLIFAPGFSTADVVTDVSGRGVGMDVVKRNITALGGTVEIESSEGYGMIVKVRLPLTLAIMDGMSVGVADECYILPLASVVESFQVKPGMVKSVGGNGRLVMVRDEYMPVVDLGRVFGVPQAEPPNVSDIMVVVEAEAGRVALLVDELLGQQQVVVKNLESNYRRVEDVSGATIMGDGRVALILDVGSLSRNTRNRASLH